MELDTILITINAWMNISNSEKLIMQRSKKSASLTRSNAYNLVRTGMPLYLSFKLQAIKRTERGTEKHRTRGTKAITS